MTISLQKWLLTHPLQSIKFLTPLNDEEVFFQRVCEDLSTIEKNEQVVFYIHSVKRNKDVSLVNEIFSAVQLTNVIGIVLYHPQKVLFEQEIKDLFTAFQVPVIQIIEALKKNHLREFGLSPYEEIARELKEFKTEDTGPLAQKVAKATNLPLIFVDPIYKITWKQETSETERNFAQWVTEQRPSWLQSFFYDLEAFLQEPLSWQQENGKDIYIGKYPIRLQNGVREIILTPSNPSNWKKEWLYKLASLISISKQKDSEMEEFNHKFQSHFIYDLIYNNFDSQKTIIEQGKTWGWNFERPHHLAVLDVGLNDTAVSDPDWNMELHDFIQKNFNERGNSFIINFQEQLLIFVEEKNVNEKAVHKKVVKNFFQTIIRACEKKWPEYVFSIGIGKCYRQTRHLNKSFQEAKMALQLGHEWSKEENVFHIEDLGVLRLLFYLNKDQLLDFSNDYLEPLLVSDRENGTDYINTLKYFILHDMSIQEASQGLFIHQNTLRKRMRKINELIGLDVYDHQDFINVSIAVKIHSIGYLH
ncbi:helix-turn-helix domain-containing protein [Salipaludibacillus sp. CUR1]|uniref:PucR family transcriptional regulator n=1 Tax=Salipaludibacillus sp. CUR1 TaxID=2820003 RepID=UPI001E51DE41|nr:helix-turn-helix domain-containing protein [Salipaludibacillus sp. CUR1]MCE7791799.1 helix-turn-helix domain-containing protein [Salipaludibacillus sp. CUR1]